MESYALQVFELGTFLVICWVGVSYVQGLEPSVDTAAHQAVAGAIAPDQRPDQMPGGDLVSAEDEIRYEKLSDGSLVAMQPGTRMQVYLSGKDSRTVSLNRGEACFTVAKDPKRPFTVQTDLINVTAVGTSFTVRASACGKILDVHQGTVRVAIRASGNAVVREYKAGEKIELNQSCSKRAGSSASSAPKGK